MHTLLARRVAAASIRLIVWNTDRLQAVAVMEHGVGVVGLGHGFGQGGDGKDAADEGLDGSQVLPHFISAVYTL